MTDLGISDGRLAIDFVESRTVNLGQSGSSPIPNKTADTNHF